MSKEKINLSLPLSGEMIQKILPFKVRIYKYSDIANFDDVDKLLEPFGCAIILFETPTTKGGSSGHWTGLCRTVDDDNNPSINFFDSYGIIPDDQKKHIDKQFQNIVGQSENYLTQLLYQAQKKYDDVIEYNQIPFQKMSPNINSCGRHVALRLIMKDLSMNQFQRFMKYLKERYGREYDEIVTILTDPVLNNEINSLDLRSIMEDLFREFREQI